MVITKFFSKSLVFIRKSSFRITFSSKRTNTFACVIRQLIRLINLLIMTFFLSEIVSSWVTRPSFKYGMLTGVIISVVPLIVVYIIVKYDIFACF